MPDTEEKISLIDHLEKFFELEDLKGIRYKLREFVTHCDRFREFLGNGNQDNDNFKKLRKKAKDAKDAKDPSGTLKDVYTELLFAYLILNNSDFHLVWEKKKGGPDFDIYHGDKHLFTAEVKHRRASQIEQKEERVFGELKRSIAKIPSGLWIRLRIDLNVLSSEGLWEAYLDELDKRSEDIIRTIRSHIKSFHSDSVQKSGRYVEHECCSPKFIARIANDPDKSDDSTTNFTRPTISVFFKKDGHWLLFEGIARAAKQVCTDIPNVIFIGVEQLDIDSQSCSDAVEELLVQPSDSDLMELKKRLKSHKLTYEDYKCRMNSVCCIVIRGYWNDSDSKNLVWKNPGSPHSVSESTLNLLKHMD